MTSSPGPTGPDASIAEKSDAEEKNLPTSHEEMISRARKWILNKIRECQEDSDGDPGRTKTQKAWDKEDLVGFLCIILDPEAELAQLKCNVANAKVSGETTFEDVMHDELRAFARLVPAISAYLGRKDTRRVPTATGDGATNDTTPTPAASDA